MTISVWLLGLIAVLIFTISPVIPALIAGLFGMNVSERDSVIGTLPWLMIYTAPLGVIALLGWIIYGFWSVI